MYIRDLGAGPVVLLLHGTPSPASDWMPVAERLARRYRVLIPDLPGYGRSPKLATADYETVDEHIASTIGERRLRAVVGFSSGAYRAFEMVLRKRVTADVVIGLGAFATFDQEGRDLRRALGERIAADPSYYVGEDMRAFLRDAMLSPSWRTDHPADLERVLGWLNVSTPEAIAAEGQAMAASEEICRLVPRATMDVVPGCGHTLLIEDLPGTVDAIAREVDA